MPILTDDERIGQTVGGGYRLDRILGRGGMGVVFAATHARVPQMRAAVKFLNATYAQNAEVVERFMREAQAAAMLKHPNVVGVMDIGVSADGAPYMMLEYLDGQTLSALLEERGGSLSPQELMTYLRPVMSAVAFAHDSGIVHRDIKPDNIFLSRTGQGHVIPKVLDFGIAKLTRDQSRAGTMAGGVLGTPTYMAPEQAQGQNVGPWSDVWSMGVVFFEALSGGLPWTLPAEAEVLQILATVMTEPPMSLRQRRPNLPTAIIEVVDRALSRDIGQRFHHMRDFDNALAGAIQRISVSDTLEPGRVSTASKSTTPFVATTMVAPAPPQKSYVGLIVGGLATVFGLLGVLGYGAVQVLEGAQADRAAHVGSGGYDVPPPPPPSETAVPTTTAPDASVAVVQPTPDSDDVSHDTARTAEHHTRSSHGTRPLSITPVGTSGSGSTTPTEPTLPTHDAPPDSPQVGRSGGLIPIDDP